MDVRLQPLRIPAGWHVDYNALVGEKKTGSNDFLHAEVAERVNNTGIGWVAGSVGTPLFGMQPPEFLVRLR